MSWFGEYGTAPRQQTSQSPKNADPLKSKNSQAKKYHRERLEKTYGERGNKTTANGDSPVALLATNGKKTIATTDRGSEGGSVRLPNLPTVPTLPTVQSKGSIQPLAPPSTPEKCHHQATLEEDSKTEFKNHHIKLPQIKITQDTTDYLQAPPRGTSNDNPNHQATRPNLTSSAVHLPSLSSKQPKHLPKTASKHWRKRVTVSWSEGGASRVVIEEEMKRTFGDREPSREKRHSTREHLRRFMMNERRELRKK